MIIFLFPVTKTLLGIPFSVGETPEKGYPFVISPGHGKRDGKRKREEPGYEEY